MYRGNSNRRQARPYSYNNDRREDNGPNPWVVNIREATLRNSNFRTAVWTGNHLQITLMCINPGESIGLEVHPSVDQFLKLEQGTGIVKMGNTKDLLTFVREINQNNAIVIPAGRWHNVINTGNVPMRLYSIYAPPQHPRGTVNITNPEK